MAKTHFVFSTMATDISYVEYDAGPPGGLPQIVRSVTIKGGAGVATKKLVTPEGVATSVSDADLDFLLNNREFKRHAKDGFVLVGERKHEVDDVAADMSHADNSRPLTDADYKPGGRAAAQSADGGYLAPPSTKAA